MNLPPVKELTIAEGTTVLVRVDFNVPLEDGTVRDDYRIRQALETITDLRDRGAKVVLISHFKGGEENSLRPVAAHINNCCLPCSFIGDCIGEDVEQMVRMLSPGEVLLLENLRMHDGEKGNDTAFAKRLAGLADVYVNEAFSVSHRVHASIVGIPEHLPSYAGYRLQTETAHLTEALDPPRPFSFLLGGAKFDTKIPLIRKFAEKAETVFVGGALAHELFAARGYTVGESLTAETEYDLSDLLERDNVIMPTDIVTEAGKTKQPSQVTGEDTIMDAGPKTLEKLSRTVDESAYVVWNGPLGDYEHGFSDGTHRLAKAIAHSNARSVVGGGDTLAAIEELALLEKFEFVSTGGGAMLDFLANEDLPGLKALRT